MYKDFETRTSYDYLKSVIGTLDEPICMLGGWAVFFQVNKRFEKAQGRPYLGSRDIDLGFQMGKELEKSELSNTIKVLTKKLGFKPLSFRLVKEIHTETGEVIEGKTVPSHFIFPMYVDLIVDSIPANFRKTFGFNPIDEPLLKFAFEEKKVLVLKEFDKKLLLPSVELLLAMKISSLPQRDKEHKRVKDVCDIFALAWYGSVNPKDVNLDKYLPKSSLAKCKKTLADDDFSKAAAQLGHEKEELKRVFDILLG